MTFKADRLISVTLILATVTYNSWVFGPWLNPDLHQSVASELAAQGQPYAWFFRLMDALTVLLLLPTIRRGNWFWWLFLASTLVEATFPLACVAQSTPADLMHSSACMDPSSVLHYVSSFTAGVGSIGAVLWHMYRRRPGTVIGAVHVVCSLVLTAALGVGLERTYVLQVLSIASISVWWNIAYQHPKGGGTITHQQVAALHRHK